MGFAVLIIFGILLWLGIWLVKKFKIDTPSISTPVLVTPEEIKNEYQEKINKLAAELANPNITKIEAEKKMNDFFFGVRVPDERRDKHLQTTITFKSNSKLTVADWRELLKQL